MIPTSRRNPHRVARSLAAIAFVATSACRTTASHPTSGVKADDGVVASATPEAATVPASPQLDARYGAPFPPAYAKAWETNPDGSTVRNPGLQVCGEGHPLQPDPNVLQIWAVLANGTLVLGTEVEVGVDENGKALKLGHPTLTGATPARIAGELRWQNQHPVINNKSGRYSAHPDRGPTQLMNAAALWATCGLTVTTKYANMNTHN